MFGLLFTGNNRGVKRLSPPQILSPYYRNFFTIISIFLLLFTSSSNLYAAAADGTYHGGTGGWVDGGNNLNHTHFTASGIFNLVPMDMTFINPDIYGTSGTATTTGAITIAADGTNTASFELTNISLYDYDGGSSGVLVTRYTNISIVGNLVGGGTVSSVNTLAITLSGTGNALTATNFNFSNFAGQQITSFEVRFTVNANATDNLGILAFTIANAADSNVAPALGGSFTTAGTVDDNSTTTPFSSVTVSDADGDNVSVSITYTAANGTLSGTGLTGSFGNYTLTSIAPATATTRLQALTFTPTANQVAVGNTVVTSFTLTPNDGTENGTSDSTTQYTATSVNDTPTDIAFDSYSVGHSGGLNAVVGSATTTDADTGEAFTYGLVAGTGDTNNGSFNINGSQLRANDSSGLLAGTYSVLVQTDDGNTSGTFAKAFTVYVYDNIAPTISSVSIPNTAMKVGDAVTVSITAGEAGLSMISGSVNGVTVTGFSDDTGGNYSATYTIVNGGTDRAAVDSIPVSFVLQDGAGNDSATYTTAIVQNADSIDANIPAISSVTVPNAAMAVGDAVTVSITAGEAGLGLVSGTFNNISVTGFSDDTGGNYSATYTVVEGHTDRAAGDTIPVSFVLRMDQVTTVLPIQLQSYKMQTALMPIVQP